MSIDRITDRVSSAKVVDIVRVLKHELKFHKVSKDGSAKFDICETDDEQSEVYGFLFVSGLVIRLLSQHQILC